MTALSFGRTGFGQRSQLCSYKKKGDEIEEHENGQNGTNAICLVAKFGVPGLMVADQFDPTPKNYTIEKLVFLS